MLSKCYIYENEDQINTDLKCSICLDPYRSPLCDTYCGHMFCFECVKRWFKLKKSCPICRRYFTKLRPVTNEKLLKELDNLLVQCTKCNEINIKRNHFNNHIKYQCRNRIYIDQEDTKENLAERLNIELSLLRMNKYINDENHPEQQNSEDIVRVTSLIWLSIILFIQMSLYLIISIPDILFLLITDTVIFPILRLIRFLITTVNISK